MVGLLNAKTPVRMPKPIKDIGILLLGILSGIYKVIGYLVFENLEALLNLTVFYNLQQINSFWQTAYIDGL
jgi:hypothetical protein